MDLCQLYLLSDKSKDVLYMDLIKASRVTVSAQVTERTLRTVGKWLSSIFVAFPFIICTRDFTKKMSEI